MPWRGHPAPQVVPVADPEHRLFRVGSYGWAIAHVDCGFPAHRPRMKHLVRRSPRGAYLYGRKPYSPKVADILATDWQVCGVD